LRSLQSLEALIVDAPRKQFLASINAFSALTQLRSLDLRLDEQEHWFQHFAMANLTRLSCSTHVLNLSPYDNRSSLKHLEWLNCLQEFRLDGAVTAKQMISLLEILKNVRRLELLNLRLYKTDKVKNIWVHLSDTVEYLDVPQTCLDAEDVCALSRRFRFTQWPMGSEVGEHFALAPDSLWLTTLRTLSIVATSENLAEAFRCTLLESLFLDRCVAINAPCDTVLSALRSLTFQDGLPSPNDIPASWRQSVHSLSIIGVETPDEHFVQFKSAFLALRELNLSECPNHWDAATKPLIE